MSKPGFPQGRVATARDEQQSLFSEGEKISGLRKPNKKKISMQERAFFAQPFSMLYVEIISNEGFLIMPS